MAKRFMDTRLVRKAWFRALPLAERLAFFYLLSECDQVGVWEPEFDIAETILGCPVNWAHLIDNCEGNIEILDNGKIWLSGFCEFQYGEIDPYSKSPAIKSHVACLRRHRLYDRVCGRDKDKDKEKDKVKVKDKEEDKDKEPNPESPLAPALTETMERLRMMIESKQGGEE